MTCRWMQHFVRIKEMEKLTERSLEPERKIEQMSSIVIELVRSCTLLAELVQITDPGWIVWSTNFWSLKIVCSRSADLFYSFSCSKISSSLPFFSLQKMYTASTEWGVENSMNWIRWRSSTWAWEGKDAGKERREGREN